MTAAKIESFTDLVTWQTGHELVLAVYKITDGFPPEERLGLTSQIRRAAVSITSNVAEGFTRSTAAEMARFYVIALGSLTELQNQLLIARDVMYITDEQFTSVAERTVNVQKLLHGLVRAVKQGKPTRADPPTSYSILNTRYS